MKPDIFFAIPGDIKQLTGGYAYDRRMKSELELLGHKVQLVPLSPTFPHPNQKALDSANTSFNKIPDGSVVLIDGLALGVLDDVIAKHKYRLQLFALCHHPLAMEAGLSDQQVYDLGKSESRALSICEHVITTSQHTATVLMSDYGVPDRKLSVARPGTDPVEFALCSGQVPRILCVATLTKRKAHDVLLRALAKLSHLDWQLILVGSKSMDPDWFQQLRTYVEQQQLQQRVEFLGPLAQVEGEYQQADLFVLPSLYEGYGMVFAEALAYGLPIIGCEAGAVPDLVPQSAGILVPPNDQEALRVALEDLLAHPEKRQELQLGAQAAAKQLPSWQNGAQIISTAISGE
ncbi:MAG: glycosyltransferase family 4 protein [Pseudohongiellaceae bacterium]|nr:glycosyltransferase family 4 protein [Pseudohongiellaceae bacterium]